MFTYFLSLHVIKTFLWHKYQMVYDHKMIRDLTEINLWLTSLPKVSLVKWSNLNLLIVTILVLEPMQDFPRSVSKMFSKVKMLLQVIFVHPTPLLKSLTFAVARLLPNGRLVARGAHDLPLGAKISNYEPEQAFKTYNSQANFLVNEWKNSLLIMYFWNEHCSWSFLSENGLKWI